MRAYKHVQTKHSDDPSFCQCVDWASSRCVDSCSPVGAGAVFSGADIVRWLMCSVPGVEEEEDAQHLGQLLLERGAIFHSEGSM